MEKHSSDDVIMKVGAGGASGQRVAREVQARQDRPNHGRVGDKCNQLPSPLAERTFQHIELKNPFHQLRP